MSVQLKDVQELINKRGLQAKQDTSHSDTTTFRFKIVFKHGVCIIRIKKDKPTFDFVFVYLENTPKELRPKISAAIMQLNLKMKLGALQMDLNDGEIRLVARHNSYTNGSCLVALLRMWDLLAWTFNRFDSVSKILDGVGDATDALLEALKEALISDAEATIPQQVEDCISRGICTASVTKKSYVTQLRMECVTCGFVGSEGICVSCSKKCHAGHELRDTRLAHGFYCDCGMSNKKICQCYDDSAVTMSAPPPKPREGLLGHLHEILDLLRAAEGKESLAPKFNVEFSVKFKQEMGETFLITPSDVKYVLVDGKKKELGEGGFGTVYSGVLCGTMPVAIKRLKISSQGDYQQFKKEANTMKSLQNDHIVAFYGVTKIDEDICIITAECNQGSLSRYVEAHKPSRVKCLEIAQQGALVLSFIHSKGMIHRDIKPDNFLMHNHQLKLADFGLTVTRRDTIDNVGGTLYYMAPELLTADSSTIQTNKIDVYAFGIVLWKLLHPKKTPYPMELLLNIKVFMVAVSNNERPKIDSNIPEQLVGLMKSCWAHDPSARPSFNEIYISLQLIKSTMESSGCTII